MKSKKNKALLAYNPYAGDGKFVESLDLVIQLYQENDIIPIPVRVVELTSLNRIFENIDPEEFVHVAAIGGDGVVNACVNCMMNHNIELPLAVFPTGVINIFANCFNYPREIRSMVEVALYGKRKRIHLGCVNGKYFVNNVNIGGFADTIKSTDPDLKSAFGAAAYIMTGVMDMKRMKVEDIHVEWDHGSYDVHTSGILVMNGNATDWRKKFNEENSSDDMFNVAIFKKMSAVKLANSINSFTVGKKNKKAYISFSCRKLRLSAKEDVIMSIDETDETKFPLEFTFVEDAMDIITPIEGVAKHENYSVFETKDYDALVSLFMENDLEFSEEEPVPTDLVKCWKAESSKNGHLLGGIVLAEREGQYIIDGIAVEPKHRKSNIGRKLLETAIDEIKARGGHTLFLVARAPGFFRKSGFVAISREEAPQFFECFTCPQYGKKCQPEVMRLDF